MMQRYFTMVHDDCGVPYIEMVASPHGNYVYFDDHQEEVARMQHCYNLLEEHRAKLQDELAKKDQEIAQLQADLNRVVGEAVWAMKELHNRLCVVDEYNREIKPEREREQQIDTFLTSPIVQALRAKQKEQP